MTGKLMFFFGLCLCTQFLSAKTVFKETFEKNGTLTDNGFKQEVRNDKDLFEVKDGVLFMSFHHSPYKGGAFRKDVPALKGKTAVSFEVKVRAEGSSGDLLSSLKIQFGNALMTFRNGKFWVYKGGSSWIQPGIIQNGRWNVVRIVFDPEKKTAEYYINDMRNPVHVDQNSKFDPSKVKFVSIGNYGLASGTVVNMLRRFEVEDLSGGDDAKSKEIPLSDVIWEENFSKGPTMSDNGYASKGSNGKDQFEISGGELKMIFHHSPYKGGTFSKELPALPGKTEFAFDVKVWAEGSSGDLLSSLKMEFGNILMMFREGHLWVYRGVSRTWFKPGLVSKNSWHSIRIRFDAEKKTAEYYIDDMKNPVRVDSQSEFDPAKSFSFTIGNYGIAKGTIIHMVRNLKAVSWTEERKSSSAGTNEMRGNMCFHGIGSEVWPVRKLAEKFGGGEATDYRLHVIGANTGFPANRFDLLPKPPVRPECFPKCIVFADMPWTAVPEYARKNMVDAVKAGADFLILRGNFTLNKGGFYKSELEEYLPVSVDDPWKAPRPKPEAEILKDKGKVAAAIGKCGKGRIIVVMDPASCDFLLNQNI